MSVIREEEGTIKAEIEIHKIKGETVDGKETQDEEETHETAIILRVPSLNLQTATLPIISVGC